MYWSKSIAFFPTDDPQGRDGIRSFMSPRQVDGQIRQAIQLAWTMLPDERKNVTDVERLVSQIVERGRRIFERMRSRSTNEDSASGAALNNSSARTAGRVTMHERGAGGPEMRFQGKAVSEARTCNCLVLRSLCGKW